MDSSSPWMNYFTMYCEKICFNCKDNIYFMRLTYLAKQKYLLHTVEKKNKTYATKCVFFLKVLHKQLSVYLRRFSAIAGNMINCGPILSWLEVSKWITMWNNSKCSYVLYTVFPNLVCIIELSMAHIYCQEPSVGWGEVEGYNINSIISQLWAWHPKKLLSVK